MPPHNGASFAERLRTGFRYPASVLPFRWVRAFCGLKLLLPFYHVVSEKPLAHVRHLYPVRDPRRFREDLEFLGRHYEPVSMDEVLRHVREGMPFRRWSVHVTVDDGLRECSDTMAPILSEKGFPATFFLNSAFLDNRALMFRYQACLLADALEKKAGKMPDGQAFSAPLRVPYAERDSLSDALRQMGVDVEDFLEKEKPYLSTEQVRGLLENGFSVGGHSIDHPLYSSLSFDEQLRQTLECQFFLEKKFALPHRVFAFPFTDEGISRRLLDTLHGEHGFHLTFGTAGPKREQTPFHLQRLPMEKTDDSARSIVGAAYAYWIAKAFLGKNTMRRK
jgi:peptidoglycan/xylan/chitin deacetylase (PgdA/CDA1 family)